MGRGAERTLDFQAMGSTCRLRVAGPAARRPGALRALAAAEAEVRRIEHRYSRYREDSVVSRINAAAGSPARIALDEETAALLRFADQLHQASDGLFDISSGVLRRVWDFKAGRRPQEQALAEVLPLIDWAAAEFDGASIRLPRAGMELDFGGFGKEYAADRAAGVLREAGLEHGYVNLGGDLRLLGPMPDGRPWRLGIAHPRQPGAVITGVEMVGGGLATSGDYERYFEQDGQRYCHILNPRTGWPVAHWQSISVLAPACLAAGALSTVAMLKGPQAPAFLNAQGVAWIAIDRNGGILRHDPHPAAGPQDRQG
jgi:thiamine biosynthesis lipoprotein